MIMMPTTQSETSFERDGYCLIGGFLDAMSLRAARSQVQKKLTLPTPSACERPHNTLVPLRWDDDLVQLVVASKQQVQAVAEAANATDLRWISGYLSIKEAHSGALWWHQDWWCWDHPVTYRRAAPQIAVLCYLNPTRVNTGALRVLPGSHHHSLPLHAYLPEAHTEQAQPSIHDIPQ